MKDRHPNTADQSSLTLPFLWETEVFWLEGISQYIVVRRSTRFPKGQTPTAQPALYD